MKKISSSHNQKKVKDNIGNISALSLHINIIYTIFYPALDPKHLPTELKLFPKHKKRSEVPSGGVGWESGAH